MPSSANALYYCTFAFWTISAFPEVWSRNQKDKVFVTVDAFEMCALNHHDAKIRSLFLLLSTFPHIHCVQTKSQLTLPLQKFWTKCKQIFQMFCAIKLSNTSCLRSATGMQHTLYQNWKSRATFEHSFSIFVYLLSKTVTCNLKCPLNSLTLQYKN